jgi:hypothetical protein
MRQIFPSDCRFYFLLFTLYSLSCSPGWVWPLRRRCGLPPRTRFLCSPAKQVSDTNSFMVVIFIGGHFASHAHQQHLQYMHITKQAYVTPHDLYITIHCISKHRIAHTHIHAHTYTHAHTRTHTRTSARSVSVRLSMPQSAMWLLPSTHKSMAAHDRIAVFAGCI